MLRIERIGRIDHAPISTRVAVFDYLICCWLRDSSAVARRELIEEQLTRSVIGAFFEVYNTLAFGFLEHLYVMALERELLALEHPLTTCTSPLLARSITISRQQTWK